jgi:hypothetical protein
MYAGMHTMLLITLCLCRGPGISVLASVFLPDLPSFLNVQVSVLVTNIAKSSVSPTQCSDDDWVLVSNILSCEIKDFSLHLPWSSFEHPKNQQSGLAKTG